MYGSYPLFCVCGALLEVGAGKSATEFEAHGPLQQTHTTHMTFAFFDGRFSTRPPRALKCYYGYIKESTCTSLFKRKLQEIHTPPSPPKESKKCHFHRSHNPQNQAHIHAKKQTNHFFFLFSFLSFNLSSLQFTHTHSLPSATKETGQHIRSRASHNTGRGRRPSSDPCPPSTATAPSHAPDIHDVAKRERRQPSPLLPHTRRGEPGGGWGGGFHYHRQESKTRDGRYQRQRLGTILTPPTPTIPQLAA